MARLTAVYPDGSSVVDGDRKLWESGRIRGDCHEARVKADFATSRGKRQFLAWCVERRLSRSMILNHELEGDGVPGLSGDVRGVVHKVRTADCDLVIRAGLGCWLGGTRI